MKKGVNWADFSARQYDPLIAGWTAFDPLAEKYYSCSPYVYCLNNPVNAVDPGGKLVIFINGMHFGDGERSAYWQNFDQAVMKYLNDYNVLYRDGSIGGVNGLPKNLGAAYRKQVGKMMGIIDIEKIIKLISDENGNIKETIKIITHSMGAAYGKGYVEAILSYLQKLGLPLNIVEFEADFAPFQPKDQQAIEGVDTYQFSHAKDNIAGNKKIKGAQNMDTSKDKEQSHDIGTFTNQIMSLPEGNYKIINGKIVKIE